MAKFKPLLLLYALTIPVVSWARQDFMGSVGALSNQLASEVGDVDGNRYNMDFSFDYHRQRQNELERRFSAHALVNDQSGTMYSVHQAYLTHRWGRSELQAGRFLLDWSDVDSHWSFGKLNNRENFTGFEPGEEGLVGVRLKRRYSNGLRYHFFATPVYLPEMNPSLEIDKSKGTIESKNPWAKAPSKTATIEGSEKPIFYDVDYPEISEVIYKPAAGINMGWGDDHWDAGVFYLRKPENQMSATVDISYDIAATEDQIIARVKPQFYYHDVFGGNLRWTNRGYTAYFSAIGIRPNEYPIGDSRITRDTAIEVEKRREDYVGGGIAKENDLFGLGLDYVARLSPFNREEDILAEDPRWNQAVHGWFRYRVSRHWQTSADGKFDMLTRDRLTTIRLSYLPSRNLMVNLGVNMIGTPADGKSYWSPYTNNDAVYAGMRYLF